MGDRANVRIKESEGKFIYVYTHWHGSEFPEMLKDALEYARDRWNDQSYLQRCIITELCKPADDATGFGVSTYPTDNEHDVLEVDTENKMVRLLSSKGWHDESPKWESLPPKVLKKWTFEDYCNQPTTENE